MPAHSALVQRCNPSGWPDTWTLVGYAVDGFRIYASDRILGNTTLDQCNGKFTYSSSTQKYTYGASPPPGEKSICMHSL